MGEDIFIKGKKILFIGIGFYDYENIIRLTLEKRGALVSYINSCEQLITVRVLTRLGLNVLAEKQFQNFRTKLIKQAASNNDIVFIIKGQNLMQQDIDDLHVYNPNAKFILYLWDSLIRHDNKELLLVNFDNIWSFDRQDCLLNSALKFRPLFYRIIPAYQEKIYALSFIGWMHSDRLAILRKLRKELMMQGKSYFLKLYMGRFTYFIKRYITRELQKSDRELITLKIIPYDEFQYVTAASVAVLDIAHPLQSGLTIRTIETLAAGCHLLTTNADIINYQEIPSTNYTIFERDELVPFVGYEIKADPLSSYFSLEEFIDQIFSN